MSKHLLQSLAVAFLGTGVLLAAESPDEATKPSEPEAAKFSEFEYKGMVSTSPIVIWTRSVTNGSVTKLDPLIRPLVDRKEDMMRKAELIKKHHKAGETTDEQLQTAEELYNEAASEFGQLSVSLASDLWSRQSLSKDTQQVAANADQRAQAFLKHDAKGPEFIPSILAVVIAAEEIERQIEAMKKRNAGKLESLVKAVRDDLRVPEFDEVPVAP